MQKQEKKLAFVHSDSAGTRRSWRGGAARNVDAIRGWGWVTVKGGGVVLEQTWRRGTAVGGTDVGDVNREGANKE
jgi:hypothetical protein